MLRFNLKILSGSKVSFKMCAIGDMLRFHCIIFCYEINQNLLQTLSFKTLNPTCIRYYINLATSILELSKYLHKWISDSRIGALAIICHVHVLSLSVQIPVWVTQRNRINHGLFIQLHWFHWSRLPEDSACVALPAI